jgi:cation:H+ antiporter
VSDPLLIAAFAAAAIVSMAASWLLVTRLERVGARLGMTEALLGMLAALAADAPEITASVTALAGHQARIGAGVTLGSNVFNLAALLGLSALVARRIDLHRRVVALDGTVAVWIACVCVAVVAGAISPFAGLDLSLIVFLPYLVFLGVPHDRLYRLRVPRAWIAWLRQAILESEVELEVAIHPARGRGRDGLETGFAIAVVIAASIAMERVASTLGSRWGTPEIVTGGLILAGVTSIPNAVAAVYLALRARGAATLSTAMNSNALNVIAGLLLPATIVGLGAPTSTATLVACWYLGLTLVALGCAFAAGGLRRVHGAVIVLLYGLFVVVLSVVA